MPEHRTTDLPLVITGTTGRVGRMLRAIWTAMPPFGITPIWCSRSDGFWCDLLHGPLDPCPPGAVILHLAADLSDHPCAVDRSIAMARAVGIAARQGRARHVLFASTAAIYAPLAKDLAETAECLPPTRYGRAKQLAEDACRAAAGSAPVTSLRIANVIGAGALLGKGVSAGRVQLDPVPGQAHGPIRSWIAPAALAATLAHLVRMTREPGQIPTALNLASPGAYGMAELLVAADYDWGFGPPRRDVLARLTLDTSRLAAIYPGLRHMTPAEMIADWRNTLRLGVSA